MKALNPLNRFLGKGKPRNELAQYGGVGERVVNDNRAPLYQAMILDTSGSMAGTSTVINEMGEAVSISKIDQLNEGMVKVAKSLRDFEENDPLRKIYLQIIELNSYGKAVFPEFQPLSRSFEEIRFEADGCTELSASLATLKTFINHKYLRDDRPCREGRGYNKPVNVILMSDGWPTDPNGIPLPTAVYRKVIDDFKNYLIKMDYYRNVNFYSVAVGDDACEDMLRYFCDGDEEMGERSHFYRVEECESLGNALDFVTRATLADRTVTHTSGLYDDLDDLDDLDDEDDGDKQPDADDGGAASDTDDGGENGGVGGNGGAGGAPDNGDTEADFYDDTSDDGAVDESIVYQIDVMRCRKDKCLVCLDNKCPEGAITVNSGIVSIDAEKCIGCGVCESECPHDAIRVAETDSALDDLYDDIE